MIPKQTMGQRLAYWEEQGKLFRLESAGQGWEENFCYWVAVGQEKVIEILNIGEGKVVIPECQMELDCV